MKPPLMVLIGLFELLLGGWVAGLVLSTALARRLAALIQTDPLPWWASLVERFGVAFGILLLMMFFLWKGVWPLFVKRIEQSDVDRAAFMAELKSMREQRDEEMQVFTNAIREQTKELNASFEHRNQKVVDALQKQADLTARQSSAIERLARSKGERN